MVVDFVFPRAQHIERFQRALVSNVSVSLFTLWAPLNVITAREAARTDREQLGPRVAECWNELARHRDELGQVV